MKLANHNMARLALGLAIVGGASLVAGQGTGSKASSALTKSLELDNWTESRFSKFADGEPLTIDESAEIDRLTQRLATFDRRVFRDPPPDEVTASQLLQHPERFRGRLVKLAGKVKHVWLPGMVAGEAANHKTETSYQVLAGDASNRYLLVTVRIPNAWTSGASGESLSVEGVFVKNIIDEQGGLVPLVAAANVQWFPNRATSAQTQGGPQIKYGMGVLGTLGVDVAMLDSIEHRKPLTRGDTGAFYELLGGVQSASGRQLVDWAERDLKRYRAKWTKIANKLGDKSAPLAKEVLRLADQGAYSVAPFFNMPNTQVGELAVFDGVVRRVLRIEAGDDADAQWAGVSHYYELALFTDDSQGNPLFFCVTELPPTFPTGEGLSEPVRVAGFFFKNWRYTSGKTSEGRAGQAGTAGGQALQSAPLFVGRAPLRIVAEPASAHWGMLVGFGFMAVLAVIWISQWRLAKSDKLFATRTLQRMHEPADPVKFDETGSLTIHEDVSGESDQPAGDVTGDAPV